MPHGRENPYQSGHAVLWSTTWWSLLVDAYPTIAQPAEPSRRSRREICTGEGAPASLGGPSQGATRRPTARSATVHAREGSSEERCGMGGGPGRGSSPGSSRLAPRWSPGPAARRRTRTGWRWWRPAQSALPGPRPDVPAQPRRRSCSDRSTATRWRIEANRCTPAGCEATEQAALPTGRPQSGSS
jgi:hypothetical protein